jgi:uncharacterized RDD family membrane protein YckC
MFCSRCGNPAPEGASFCPRCGAALSAGGSAVPAPSVAPMPAPGEAPAQAPPPLGTAPSTTAMGSLYAGFWRRFCAAFVDGIILAIAGAFLDLAFRVSIVEPDWTGSKTWFSCIVKLVLGWLYSALFESSARQGTLGQQLLDIRVTDLQGRRISFARATGRHFGQIVSVLILCVGYIMIALTEKKQALHDMMAGCLLVRESRVEGVRQAPAATATPGT